jgi:hypothetical protein
MTLDLNDEETAALAALLRHAIADDRYPLSPRIRVLQAILDRIEPPPVRELLPPPRHYEPPRAGRRRAGEIGIVAACARRSIRSPLTRC